MNTIITLIIIGLIVFIGLIFWTQSKRSKISNKDQSNLKKHWRKIQEAGLNNTTVLEGDKVFDHALKLKGFTGSVGEKLKKNKALFSDLNGIWNAHKLRNRIAHEIGITVSKKEISEALHQFKKAIKDLGFKL
jgi:hypothetical protein